MGATRNRQIVEAAYEAYGRGDLDDVVDSVVDDVRWTNHSRAPYAGTYKGKDGVRAFFDALGIIDIEQFDVHTPMDQDDMVVALVDSRRTVKATGRTVANRLFHVLTVVGRRTAAAEPVVHALLEVLLALGLVRRVETGRGPAFVCWPSVGAVASGRAKEFLLGDLRSTHYQAADLVERARRGDIAEEWRHTDPQLLDAQGVRSADAVAPLSARLFPMLEGLSESLERHGAAFLDVGTGVGWLAVEMCRRFPNLRAVGIDPYETALAHARRNIASVGLEGRIELRAQPVEELADDRRFDIAWVPAMFLGHDRAARGLERIFHGLKPGAWALVASMADEGEELQPAVLRLIAVQYGGGGLFPEHVAGMLSAARFADVFVMPPMPGVAIRLTMGRRPPD